MKKLLVLVLLVVAVPLSAAEFSDILLTSTGTLYTISSETPAAEERSEASTYLVLTERKGDVVRREVVPGSNVRGAHLNGLLGYDAESGMLFVLWVQHFGYLYNQPLLTTRDSEGRWSESSPFGSPSHYRENLRIAVTRKVADPETGGFISGLTVHATWWELDGHTGRQSAQYRMMPIENGRVKDPTDVDLNEFLSFQPTTTVTEADPSVLKQPLLFATPEQNSVILVFANWRSGNFSKVRITPTRGIALDGRIRIPVGKRETGFPAPTKFAVDSNSRLEGVFGSRTALYTIREGMLRYVMLGDEGWTEERTVALDEQITDSAAVSALRRMVAEQ